MFFTRVGSILAYLGFALGAFRFVVGLFFATTTQTMDANVAAAQRYLGAANTGEAINEAVVMILISVALGILCEISKRSMDKRQ